MDREIVLDLIKDGFICIEIGCWKGDFSSKIREAANIKKLILIDPWMHIPKFKYRWYGKRSSQEKIELIYKSVCDKFKNDSVVEIIRKKSDDAHFDIPENYVDFVYIDGDHSKDAIINDIKNYWPKVKNGGYLVGDDYCWKGEGAKLALEELEIENFFEGRDILVKHNQFIVKK